MQRFLVKTAFVVWINLLWFPHKNCATVSCTAKIFPMSAFVQTIDLLFAVKYVKVIAVMFFFVSYSR